MAKLRLNPDPHFKAKVAVPVPGGKTADIEFTFQYRPRSELEKWRESLEQMREGATEADLLRTFALGWDLDDQFNDDNIVRLCDNYPGTCDAVIEAYLRESLGARRGN